MWVKKWVSGYILPCKMVVSHSSQKTKHILAGNRKDSLLGANKKPSQFFLSDSSQQKPIFHEALIPDSASVCDKGALNVLQR